ncbi:hypothetical protein V2J09_019497 [Rumex salicifolius]
MTETKGKSVLASILSRCSISVQCTYTSNLGIIWEMDLEVTTALLHAERAGFSPMQSSFQYNIYNKKSINKLISLRYRAY